MPPLNLSDEVEWGPKVAYDLIFNIYWHGEWVASDQPARGKVRDWVAVNAEMWREGYHITLDFQR